MAAAAAAEAAATGLARCAGRMAAPTSTDKAAALAGSAARTHAAARLHLSARKRPGSSRLPQACVRSLEYAGWLRCSEAQRSASAAAVKEIPNPRLWLNIAHVNTHTHTRNAALLESFEWKLPQGSLPQEDMSGTDRWDRQMGLTDGTDRWDRQMGQMGQADGRRGTRMAGATPAAWQRACLYSVTHRDAMHVWARMHVLALFHA
eukprot:356295-Chlamydomonas_euryale.AAC.27